MKQKDLELLEEMIDLKIKDASGDYSHMHSINIGVIAALRSQLTEEEKPKERWKPEVGEAYYFVDSSIDISSPTSTIWLDGKNDKGRYEFGNVFRNREAAEAAARKVKEVLLSL